MNPQTFETQQAQRAGEGPNLRLASSILTKKSRWCIQSKKSMNSNIQCITETSSV